MTTAGIELSGIPYEATQVDEWLRKGKPELGWRGDPRLSLRIGVVTASKSGYARGRYRRKGDVLGRQYQVWRWNEDGTEERLLSRQLNAIFDIIPALVAMDPRTPGFTPVHETVERANKLEEKHRSDDFREAHGEAVEHLWSIVGERTAGRLTHRQVGGSDERADRNLAK